MANPIAPVTERNATPTAIEVQSNVKSGSQKPIVSTTQVAPSPVNDTVSISAAAKAAQQETVETPSQTAKEARSGDRQAQRLLAKEAAAKKLLQ
jgi:hypothetical protein